MRPPHPPAPRHHAPTDAASEGLPEGATCAACGATNQEPGAKFCSQCGAALVPDDAPRASPTPKAPAQPQGPGGDGLEDLVHRTFVCPKTKQTFDTWPACALHLLTSAAGLPTKEPDLLWDVYRCRGPPRPGAGGGGILQPPANLEPKRKRAFGYIVERLLKEGTIESGTLGPLQQWLKKNALRKFLGQHPDVFEIVHPKPGSGNWRCGGRGRWRVVAGRSLGAFGVCFGGASRTVPRDRPGAPADCHPLTAVGYPPTAVRSPPTAVGYPPTAVGYPPTAVGYPPTAVRSPPTAVGYPPTAVGYPPTAVGYPPTAVGYPPTAVGYPPTTLGYPPTAVGYPPTTVRSPPTAVATVGYPPTVEPGLTTPADSGLTCATTLCHEL